MDVLARWWADRESAIPRTARGLWFGIVELGSEDQFSGGEFVLYVAACPSFDGDDEHADWAADEYVYFPKSRSDYVALSDFGVQVTEDWSAVLTAVAGAVQQLHPESSVDVDGIAVGYDDGDHLVIWRR